MTKEKIEFHTEKRKMALLISFITNAFSASVKFSTSVKIMKCTFIAQNNGYCLKLKR